MATTNGAEIPEQVIAEIKEKPVDAIDGAAVDKVVKNKMATVEVVTKEDAPAVQDLLDAPEKNGVKSGSGTDEAPEKKKEESENDKEAEAAADTKEPEKQKNGEAKVEDVENAPATDAPAKESDSDDLKKTVKRKSDGHVEAQPAKVTVVEGKEGNEVQAVPVTVDEEKKAAA